MKTTEPFNKETRSAPLSGVDVVSLFNYSDYREYLKAFYQLKKTTMVGYSYAAFSMRAGIKSPNYLKLIMDGERNLTGESIASFARALGLNETETAYWELLVNYGQAKSATERQFYLLKLSRFRLPLDSQGEAQGSALIRRTRDEWEFYAGWQHMAIRELVLLPEFKSDPQWIAQALRGRISANDAAKSLELLKRLNYLIEDKNGRLTQAEMQVLYKAVDGQPNLAIRDYHRSTAELACEALEDDSDRAHVERYFRGLTIAVTRETLPLIKQRLASYMRELNTEFSIDPQAQAAQPDAAKADQVFHVNFQLIPMSTNPEPLRSPKKPQKAAEKARTPQ